MRGTALAPLPQHSPLAKTAWAQMTLLLQSLPGPTDLLPGRHQITTHMLESRVSTKLERILVAKSWQCLSWFWYQQCCMLRRVQSSWGLSFFWSTSAVTVIQALASVPASKPHVWSRSRSVRGSLLCLHPGSVNRGTTHNLRGTALPPLPQHSPLATTASVRMTLLLKSLPGATDW